jgi:phosphatidylinositol alpha 1,6-mannosyltransferase
MSSLRVALFTDSFDEANGVATLCQQFAAFALQQQIPFLCVRSGARTRVICEQSLTTLELKRSLAAFPLDYDLRCDPLLSRYKNWVTAQLRLFRADLVHITGPGDFGILGFWAAHSLGIPLVASWHTNLHEYAGRRLDKLFSRLPTTWRRRIIRTGEDLSLHALVRFYRLPRFLLAPNESMIHLLSDRTHRPTYFMPHGVDTGVYSPTRRNQRTNSFCIGYVGRLTPEKSVRLFVELERRLLAAGQRDFRLVLVGEGSEKEWLKNNLQSAELPGILRGEALAEAFASMDVFVFPSRTDTFGLVLLEAMASGVPVVVSPETGVRVEVQHGITGFVAQDIGCFTQSVLRLMESEALRREMSRAARRFACSKVWSGVFEQVYRTYEVGLEECGLATPSVLKPRL